MATEAQVVEPAAAGGGVVGLQRRVSAPEGTAAADGTSAILADRDTGFIAVAAVRYALGRRTYAVDLTASWVRRNWQHLGAGTQGVIARDVSEAIRQYERHLPGGDLEEPSDNLHAWSREHLGQDCDRWTWYGLRDWMREQGVEQAG